MNLRLLLLLTAALCVNAEIGSLLLECQGPQWHIYHSQHETSCIRLMSEPKLFNEAYKECFSLKARMLSFNHRRRKLEFVNSLIIKQFGNENVTLWNFESLGVHEDLVSSPPDPNGWLVIEPNEDVNKIALKPNSTNVPRNYICEAPARLAAQTPRFSVQPEDLQISSELINVPTEQRTAFFATYNCLAFALPRPKLRWVLVHEVNGTVGTKPLEAKMIFDAREPLKERQTHEVAFYDLRTNCQTRECNSDGVQQRSQLIVMNPQLLDLQHRIACVASNEFGVVMSREAQMVVTRMTKFQQQQSQVYTVTAGANITIPCVIGTEPDAAAVEWFKVEEAGLVPLEEVNRRTLGGLQMSKTTFQLLVDSADLTDAGEYVCRVLMHNGRVRQTSRDLTVRLEVLECLTVPCDLSDKPVSVVTGFPTVLSMNPMSNKLVRSGDDCLLECPCVGKRSPDQKLTVTWNMTQGGAVPLKVLPAGSALLFRNANERHSGVYSCRCEREHEKSAWSSVQLQVLPPVTPVDFRDFMTAKVGGRATLECRVPAHDGVQVKVTPMRGDVSLIGTSDNRLNLSVKGGSYSLTISPVRLNDSDAYGCHVTANFFDAWTERDTFYTTLSVS